MKTSELTGHLLDYWTGKALGKNVIVFPHQRDGSFFCVEKMKDYVSISTHIRWNPSEDWAIAGPLIKDRGIGLVFGEWHEGLYVDDIWTAFKEDVSYDAKGEDPLTAVCRLLVWIKFGDEVPDEGGRE